MGQTTKQALFGICKWIVITTIGSLLFWISCRNIIKGYRWHYDVDISYVYEGEDEIHHVNTDFDAHFNATVKDIDVIFSTEPGYINCLILYIAVKEAGREYCGYTREKRIMEVPDKRFKVVDIIATKGPRTEE